MQQPQRNKLQLKRLHNSLSDVLMHINKKAMTGNSILPNSCHGFLLQIFA